MKALMCLLGACWGLIACDSGSEVGDAGLKDGGGAGAGGAGGEAGAGGDMGVGDDTGIGGGGGGPGLVFETGETMEEVGPGEGATLSVAGVVLEIPAGALPAGATVRLFVEPRPEANLAALRLPVTPGVRMEIEPTQDLILPATLKMPWDPTGTDGVADALLLHWLNPTPLPPSEDEHVIQRYHAIQIDADQLVGQIVRPGTWSGHYMPPANPALLPADEDFKVEPHPHQVPFYWQVGIGWCVPTSGAMILNYFQPLAGPEVLTPSGRTANYTLAGQIKQDRQEGHWPHVLMDRVGVPRTAYEYLRWDSDLITGNGFKRHIINYTNGFTIHWLFGGDETISARPVWMDSDRSVHAGLISGANETYLWIHSSNDQWMGSVPSRTWLVFRDENCLPADPTNPDAGCSDNPSPDLTTYVMPRAVARPEAERRGALDPRFQVGGESAMFSFVDRDGDVVARMIWDGRKTADDLGVRVPLELRWPHGFYLRDEADFRDVGGGQLANGGLDLLPNDEELGNIVPRATTLRLALDVVNATEATLPYRVEVHFDGNLVEGADVMVDGFSRGGVDFNIPLEDITADLPTVFRGKLRLSLTQNGVLQDEKIYPVAIGPASAPVIRLIEPPAGTEVQANVPVTFAVDVTDADAALDPSCCLITWDPQPNFTGVLTGPRVAYLFNNLGPQNIRVTARDPFGLTSTVEIPITVVNPSPQPVINAQPQPIFPGQQVQLTGTATDLNEAEGILPCNGLSWTALEAGDAVNSDGCNGLFTFAAQGLRRVRLTARDGFGATASVEAAIQVDPVPVNFPPNPRIISPRPNQVIDWMLPVRLEGVAPDPENDNPVSFEWSATSYFPDDRTIFDGPDVVGVAAVVEAWFVLGMHDIDSCQGGDGQRLDLTLQATDRLGHVGRTTIPLIIACPPG